MNRYATRYMQLFMITNEKTVQEANESCKKYCDWFSPRLFPRGKLSRVFRLRTYATSSRLISCQSLVCVQCRVLWEKWRGGHVMYLSWSRLGRQSFPARRRLHPAPAPSIKKSHDLWPYFEWQMPKIMGKISFFFYFLYSCHSLR